MPERKTQQRDAIRQVLAAADRPMSPQEVLQSARRRSPGLGIATVYRALKSLSDEGFLVAVDLPGEASRFELAGKKHHHHFHCRDCGRAFDLEGCVPTVQRLAPKGFRVEDHEVVLYGLCAACA
jgi:Fur family transcriptional regulator, ferric uptake regulator